MSGGSSSILRRMDANRKAVPWWLKAVVFVMFGLCIVMGVVLYTGVSKLRASHRELTARLEREGFEKIETTTDLVVTNPPSRPTWYIARTVKLLNGADASVAMYCATGEISGVVRGDVVFLGLPLTHPTLIINPGAQIASNVETTCWMLKNFGEVRGEFRGTKYFYVTNQTPLTTGTAKP